MKLLKIILNVLILFSATVFALYSQQKNPDNLPGDTTVYFLVDTVAAYPGGMTELVNFINSKTNCKFPEGTAWKPETNYLRFVVDRAGKVTDLNSGNHENDPGGYLKDLVSVMQSAPAWIPARMNNEAVSSVVLIDVHRHRCVTDSITVLNFVRKDSIHGDLVFSIVDEYPVFPGSNNALRDFLVNNVKYPRTARKKGLQGTVYFSFVIDSAGSVRDIRVLPLKIVPDQSFVQEGMRVLGKMPKWKPAVLLGKKVNCRIALPIRFVLN